VTQSNFIPSGSSSQQALSSTPSTTSPAVSPIPKLQQHHISNPISTNLNLSSDVGSSPVPMTPTQKTETPVTTPNNKSASDSDETDEMRAVLSNSSDSETENTSSSSNGLRYTETAPKLLSSKIATLAQSQKN